MISVIIPTYNRAQLLKLTVESILNQTTGETEILIVDDGSTDDTEKTVMEFKSDNIKYFKLPKSGNIGRLRNFGIQHSSNDILAFCDDDDIWEKEKLSIQLPYLDKYDFVCSNGKLVDSENNMIKEKYFDISENFLISPEILIKDNYILTPTVLLKKNIISGKKFEDTEYRNLCEDYHLWMQIVFTKKIFFINEDLVRIRRHLSTTQDLNNRISVEKNLLKIVTPFRKSKDKDIKDASYSSVFNKKYYLLKIYLEQKKYIKCFSGSFGLALSLFNYRNLFLFSEKIINKIKKRTQLD